MGPSGVGRLPKQIARRLIGTVSPGLLRNIDQARERARYLREPERGPQRLLLEPTTECNHRCQMCHEHSLRRPAPTIAHRMPFDQASRLLRDAAGIGVEWVWLAGRGEPLVHPQAVEIFALIGALGMRSSVTTNGQRLTEDLSDKLCDSGLMQLSVSIDSGNADTYALIHNTRADDRARILGLIKRLSQRTERKPKLLVSMVISRPNCRQILDFLRDALDAGVDGVVFGGMRPVPFDSTDLALDSDDWARVRDDLAEAAELARRAGVEFAADTIPSGEKPRQAAWPYGQMACFIGHSFAVIDVDGNVHGCCTCQNRLGSLVEASFAEVWYSPAYRTYRKILREMPMTGLTPPLCDCRFGCGHLPENAALQQELGFRFGRRATAAEFSTRLDMARSLVREFGGLLPKADDIAGFADLRGPAVDDEARRAATQLRQLGIIRGSGSLDGLPLFDPGRMLAREEVAEVLRRTLDAAGLPAEQAREVIAETATGSLADTQPMTKRELEEWLSRAAARAGRKAG